MIGVLKAVAEKSGYVSGKRSPGRGIGIASGQTPAPGLQRLLKLR
jgi:hypothetical protein